MTKLYKGQILILITLLLLFFASCETGEGATPAEEEAVSLFEPYLGVYTVEESWTEYLDHHSGSVDTIFGTSNYELTVMLPGEGNTFDDLRFENLNQGGNGAASQDEADESLFVFRAINFADRWNSREGTCQFRGDSIILNYSMSIYASGANLGSRRQIIGAGVRVR